jgi:hypothetical protein
LSLAEQRLVSLGPTDGDLVAVKGVAAGDQIISGNLQKIGPGAPVQPLAGGAPLRLDDRQGILIHRQCSLLGCQPRARCGKSLTARRRLSISRKRRVLFDGRDFEQDRPMIEQRTEFAIKRKPSPPLGASLGVA